MYDNEKLTQKYVLKILQLYYKRSASFCNFRINAKYFFFLLINMITCATILYNYTISHYGITWN